jgi:hypothetical protein
MFDPNHIAAVKRARNAEKQRRFRARRRSGLRGYRLYLPIKKIERAIRARNGLAPDAPVAQQTVERLLMRAIDVWATSWVIFRRHR